MEKYLKVKPITQSYFSLLVLISVNVIAAFLQQVAEQDQFICCKPAPTDTYYYIISNISQYIYINAYTAFSF